jgi:hypothetical protein
MDDEPSKHDGGPNSVESIGRALERSFRRRLATIDLSDEDEVIGVMQNLFSFTTMVLAEEAYAAGLVDPLGHLEGEVGWLRDAYSELTSRVVRRADDDGVVSDNHGTPF